MNREYHKWFSPNLGRDMELLVFGHAGARTLVFPARLGRFFDYENWGLVHALRDSLENGCVQLFCVDGVDAESIYCGWCRPSDRIARHSQFERYILEEVLPFSKHNNPNPFAISHGCSLGAYHAVNIAFRHPHEFGKVVGLSGRYDLTAEIGHYRSLFDGHYEDAIYFHTPSHYIPNLTDHVLLERLRKLEIILVIGDEDPFLENNRHLSKALWDKGVWNAMHFWRGEAHRPRFWREMVRLYL
jgi:esterase/lipase superfamily enzyme